MKVSIKRWKCKSDKPLAGFPGFGKKWKKNNPCHFGMVNFQNGVDKRCLGYRNSSIGEREYDTACLLIKSD